MVLLRNILFVALSFGVYSGASHVEKPEKDYETQPYTKPSKTNCIRHPPLVLPGELPELKTEIRDKRLEYEEKRQRRSTFDKGFKDFTPQTNSRGTIHSSKSFGPNSHGGVETAAKLEHDFWKSNDGNHRISGFAQHSRVDGGRFDGFKDNKAGVGYIGRFRRYIPYDEELLRFTLGESSPDIE